MKSREAVELLGDRAAGQWGLITSAQARGAGVSAADLQRLRQSANIERVRHGVYALAGTAWEPALEIRAEFLALAPEVPVTERPRAPEGPVVSHASAAELHALGDLDTGGVHFTSCRRRQTRQTGVHIHRGTVPLDEQTTLDGLPVTTPLRTVVDLARVGVEPGHLWTMVTEILARDPGALTEIQTTFGPRPAVLGFDPQDAAGLRAELTVAAAHSPITQKLLTAPIVDQALRTHIDELLASTSGSTDAAAALSRNLAPQLEQIGHIAAASDFLDALRPVMDQLHSVTSQMVTLRDETSRTIARTLPTSPAPGRDDPPQPIPVRETSDA